MRTAAASSPDVWVLTARILVAAVLGAAIGFEREYRGQSAGLRTHLLVSVGAALFSVVGVYVASTSEGPVDETRIAAQIVSGIGFLGAGAIIQQGMNVRGLTTAATLWVTAAVGTAAGLGYYEGAVVATVVTGVALVMLKLLKTVVFPRASRTVRDLVVDVDSTLRLADVVRVISDNDGTVVMTRVAEDAGDTKLTASIRLAGGSAAYAELVQAVSALPGVRAVTWSR